MSRESLVVKEETSLQKLQKKLSTLVEKVDKFTDSLDASHSLSSPERKQDYNVCGRLIKDIALLENELNSLQMDNGKPPIKNFTNQKKAEQKKLNELKSRIERISQQLEPDEVEEDYFRKVQAGQVSNSDLQSGLDEGEEYEDDEDDDSEEDDEDENALHTDQVSKTVVVRNVEALSDFPGEQQEDLPFKKGEVLIVIDPREDGWWIAENSVGKRGVIPKTLVKIVGNEDKERQKKELAHDQENDQVGDLPPSPTRSGKQLWNSLKKGSKQETSVTDVLKVMGAMPSGFKSTTLGRLAKEERFMVSSWVVPKLRASHLGFRDLVWDPVNKQIAPWPVKVNRVFTVVVARKIPLPGTGVQVLCRHVRIALWDWRRKQILSNVHTVRATTTEKDPLTWSFTAKAATSMYDGEGLARLNTTEDTVALLFELGILYLRTSTGERSEVSCGWCILKLFEETGTPIPNKTFELLVHGGTPYDENLTDLDHTLSVQENTNLFQSIVRTNNQPRLFIKLTSSNKASKDVQDNLPATLLTCNQYVPFIAHYRQLVGVTLLDGTRDTFDGELLTDPVIASFPTALRTPDVMDTLKKQWDGRKSKDLNRSQRKSTTIVKNFFREVYMDSVYPVMNSANLAPFIWGDDKRERERLAWILEFENRSVLENLFSSDRLHKPFNMDRLTFNVLSRQSVM